MKFPKEEVEELKSLLKFFFEDGETFSPDPKDLETVVTYADLCGARITELENQNSELMLKLRFVAQALK